MEKEKYKKIFDNYTLAEECLPEVGDFVIVQIDFNDRHVSMVICKVGKNGKFLFGKKLRPIIEGHITAWKKI